MKGEIMRSVFERTATKSLPDPDAAPPEPTPENLARPTPAKTRAKRKSEVNNEKHT
jgi:hypothetical protein